MTDADARIRELENEVAALHAKIERLRPRPVPAAASYPDGRTTISTVKNRIILPTMDELHRLEEMVHRAYPKLRAGGDSDSFRAAFHRLTYAWRAERLDAKRSLDFWVDQAEDWLKAQGYYISFETRVAIFRRRGNRNGGHRIFGPEPFSGHEPRDHRSAAIRSLAGALAAGPGERASARAYTGTLRLCRSPPVALPLSEKAAVAAEMPPRPILTHKRHLTGRSVAGVEHHNDTYPRFWQCLTLP
jgi:hypothetical protein